MRKVQIFLVVWAVILAGCVHFRTVSTEIAPTVTTPEKYPARVAVYFAPQLLNCEVTRKPDTRYGAEHEYHYRWGPAMQEALIRSVKTAYTDVTAVTGLPGRGQFDRVIAFDLSKVDLVVEFVPGYLRQEARARASINLTMEILEGKTMRSLKNLRVTARGASTQDASGFAAYASSKFTQAMERAIQQLSEIVSNLVITGAAEPK